MCLLYTVVQSVCSHRGGPFLFDRIFPLISRFQAAGAFIRMYSGLCTAWSGLVNNGENETLSGLGLRKGDGGQLCSTRGAEEDKESKERQGVCRGYTELAGRSEMRKLLMAGISDQHKKRGGLVIIYSAM